MSYQNTQSQEKQNNAAISGANIMSFTEEAIQEKRLTLSSLIEKMNAEVVVGDIIDEHEEQRKKTIEEQKNQLQKEQDEQEAEVRQKLEEERLAAEAEADAESNKQKKKPENDGMSALTSTVSDISKKVRTEFFKNGVIKKLLKVDDIPEPEEDDTDIEEIEEKKTKKEVFKNGKKSSLFKRKDTSDDDLEDEEPEVEIAEDDFVESKKAKLTKQPKKVKEPKQPKQKPEKPVKSKSSKKKKGKDIPTGRKVFATEAKDAFIEQYEEQVEEIPVTAPVQQLTPEERYSKELSRRTMMQEDISRFHEQVSNDEVYRFRNALERLSSDSYRSVSVYAACIIDKDFKALSIIKNVSLLAELIEESGDDMDFYYAYIITNKGVQHYGNDEALSDVSLAIEAIRTLFVQKKGRVTVEQIQKLPALQIFQTIYYEDHR